MSVHFFKNSRLFLLTAFLGACSLFNPQQPEYGRLQRTPASLSQSGLEELEKILDQADSLEEFLSNEQLKESYYFHLLKYYGKDQGQVHISGFKNYYQTILRALSQMTEKNPEAAARLWEKIDTAEQKSFQVSGSLNSSGIALNAENLEAEYLPRLQRELRSVLQASEFSSDQLPEVVDQILADFEATQSLSKREKGLAIKALKEGPSMRWVQAHFALKFLESPNVAEMIQTQDADIIMQALKRLPKVSLYADQVADGVQLPGVFNISDTSWLPTLSEIEDYFEKARKLKRDFELIASSGTDDELIRRTNQEKRELIERGSRENPLFYLETTEQAHNKKLILKQAGSGGKELRVVAVPRRFHAVFRAARHDECVKDQCAKWGSAFMRDAEFYFTETNNQKMTGYLQILPVRSKETQKTYGALEVMTPSTGGEVISLDEQGLKLKKTAKFDMMIEELSERLPENIQTLVTSDGNGANNAGGKNAVYNSNSYVLGELIAEKPGELELVEDELTKGLAIKSSSSYSSQKFIGDGVNTNGTELRVLLPASQRQSMSYDEFIPQYLKYALKKNQKMLESMRTRAEASNLEIPDSTLVNNWLQGRDLPLERLTSEQTREVFSIDDTFFKWINQRDYRPGEDPEVDRWINDSDFFQEVLQKIKKNPEHPGAQVFYRNAWLREKFLSEGGRSLAAEVVLGSNRDLERRFMGALSEHISSEELLDGEDVKRAVYDWFFESENISAYTNLKKRKNFSMIERLFDPNDLFEEFKKRMLSGGYYQQREALQVFARSSVFQDLPAPLIREWESLLEGEAFHQFFQEEIRAGVFGDFLTQLQKKSETLDTQKTFASALVRAFRGNLDSQELSLESGVAQYLKREKIFTKAPELHKEMAYTLRESPQFQRLLEASLNQEFILTSESLAWAEFVAEAPIENEAGEKFYQQMMGAILSRPIEEKLNLNSFQRYETQVSFSSLVKAMVEKHHTKELPAYMYSSSFMQSFLDGLAQRAEGESSSFMEKPGTKLEQRIASTHSELPQRALEAEGHAQGLYRLYQERLGQAPPSLRSGLVENLNLLMSGQEGSSEDALALILKAESFPGLKLLSESREELVKTALNNEEFIQQMLGPYLLDFLSEAQSAAPSVRNPFFTRVEGTAFAERMQKELIPALFKAGHGARAQAVFKKPFIDFYPSKTVMAQQVVKASLEHAPAEIFTHLGLLSQSLKVDEFPYESLNDVRFRQQISQSVENLRWHEAAPVLKFVRGEALEALESSEDYARFLGQMLYRQDALIKGEEVLVYQNFFKNPEFYRGLFETGENVQIENRLKFLMKNNIAPLVEQEVMSRELQKNAEFYKSFQELFFSSIPDRRKVATGFIHEFPELARENGQLLDQIRALMLTPHRANQANLLNILKSKGGQTLLRQSKNREALLESLTNSDLEDVQKQRFLKVLLAEADPSCQRMMGQFL